MIDTILVNTSGTHLGGARFPAVPLRGQAVVYNNGRYVIRDVEWHASPDANMVLVVDNAG